MTGTVTAELLLIDEVHTPDSSRFWVADTYAGSASRAGDEPAGEPRQGDGPSCLRRPWLQGRRPASLPSTPTCGPPPRTLHPAAYERLTGTQFEPGDYPVADRLVANLQKAGLL